MHASDIGWVRFSFLGNDRVPKIGGIFTGFRFLEQSLFLFIFHPPQKNYFKLFLAIKIDRNSITDAF